MCLECVCVRVCCVCVCVWVHVCVCVCVVCGVCVCVCVCAHPQGFPTHQGSPGWCVCIRRWGAGAAAPLGATRVLRGVLARDFGAHPCARPPWIPHKP